MESILTSIKKLLGITEEYEHFDQDLIIHINSVFSILSQLGVGHSDEFFIQDKTAVWSDFIGSEKAVELVKSYIYLKVKMLFDPPTSSAVIESTNRIIGELEWRITTIIDEKRGVL